MRPLDMIRAGLAFATAAGASAAQGVETPDYEVIARAGEVELRRYAPMILAEVTVEADSADVASSRGFAPLAGYIFGQNRPGTKIKMTAPVRTVPADTERRIEGGDGERIAMTAPVRTAPAEGDTYVVQFVMPADWTMETLPAPVNEAVRIVPQDGRHMVVAGYTGPRVPGRITEMENRVSRFIEDQRLTPTGPFEIAGYSGPSVPAARKYWEVQREVAAP